MHYFIPSTYNHLLEVTADAYDNWYNAFAKDYLLPECYFVSKEGHKYSIETMYQGACDKSENPPLPFVVIFFPDKSIITPDGIKTIPENEEYYFATYQEMKTKYDKLIADNEEIHHH
jgi:hypothetical protein